MNSKNILSSSPQSISTLLLVFFYFCDLLKNLIFLVISRFEPWEVELLPNFDTFSDF